METITEDYCDFETAKLLKEKGFDGECRDYYNTEGHFYSEDFKSNWNHARGAITIFSAPTLQMAMKWLREVHGLFISIGNDDLDYNWQIFDVKNRTKDLDPTCLTDSYAGYIKYELACTLAIKYCLEHLI